MKLRTAITIFAAAVIGAAVFVFVEIRGGESGGFKLGSNNAEACTEAAPDCLPLTTMVDRSGQLIEPESLSGKIVIINVWATWCKPCTAELPELVELRDRYSEREVVLLGVLTDRPSTATVDGFVSRFGINYPIIPVTRDIDAALGSPTKLPTTFIYDQSGHLVKRRIGAVTVDGLGRIIERLSPD